jgi:Uri superfamily endonuclease
MPLVMGLPLLDELPSEKGTYILFLQLAESRSIEVGRYGTCIFPAGIYAYAGSAHGNGGIAARIKHHLNLPERPHWHIDYVRPSMHWEGVFYATDPLSNECTWSKRLFNFPGSRVIIPSFGASDCQKGCPAHLFAFLKRDFDPAAFLQHFDRSIVLS